MTRLWKRPWRWGFSFSFHIFSHFCLFSFLFPVLVCSNNTFSFVCISRLCMFKKAEVKITSSKFCFRLFSRRPTSGPEFDSGGRLVRPLRRPRSRDEGWGGRRPEVHGEQRERLAGAALCTGHCRLVGMSWSDHMIRIDHIVYRMLGLDQELGIYVYYDLIYTFKTWDMRLDSSESGVSELYDSPALSLKL